MALYDAVADVYDKSYTDAVYKAEDNIVVQHLLKIFRPWEHSICDLGCGTGFLVEKTGVHAAEYEGVDISSGMVAQARKKFPYHSFSVGDIEKTLLFPDRHFDVAASLFGAYNYLTDPLRAAQEMHRVLQPGGKIFLTILGPRYLNRKRYLLNRENIDSSMTPHSSKSVIATMQEAGFVDIQVQGVNFLGDIFSFLPERVLQSYMELESGLLGKKFPDVFYHLIITGRKDG